MAGKGKRQFSMYELIIIGAGPAGISMAAEARSVGISSEQVLVLEKVPMHSWATRKFYPAKKVVTANYKGIEAACKGVSCISDMSKDETLTYIDRAIEQYQITVHYDEGVNAIRPLPGTGFTVETSQASYQTRRCVIAIGILDKPNKPEYRIPSALNKRIHYDLNSAELQNRDCLVVGGGDTASEYCQYLVERGNRVTLSYRRTEFSRLNSINYQSLMALEQRGQVTILRGSNIKELQEERSSGAPVDTQEVNKRVVVLFEGETFPSQTFDHIVYAL